MTFNLEDKALEAYMNKRDKEAKREVENRKHGYRMIEPGVYIK